MEANSSCLILRTFASVGYKESEEHIFISRKPFPLQNHRSLEEMLASCRAGIFETACGFFVQCLLHIIIHSELLQIGLPRCLNLPVYWGRKPHRLMMLSFTVRLVKRCFRGSCVCFINVFVKNHLSIDAVDVFDFFLTPMLPVLCLGSKI